MLIQLFLAMFATLLILVMGRDYLEKRLPKKLNLNEINNYLNSNHHWHGVGHFLVQFMVMAVLGSFGVILGLCIGFGSALFIEFVLQRNKLKQFDTIFDLITHFLGTLAALSLFL